MKKLIGKMIRFHRIKCELTQAELGVLVGCDEKYISKLENGKVNLTLDYLESVIMHLQCTMEEFLNTKV